MWTTEPPTEEGFYWATNPWGVVLVRVEESNGCLYGIEMDRMDLYPHKLDRFTQWCGPILPPEPPTKDNQ